MRRIRPAAGRGALCADAPSVVIFGGKGGVGKTTMASAYALARADEGHRTLLLSTDPAHSLGDAFGVRIDDVPREIAPNLWARQPDADVALRARMRQVGDDAAAAVPAEIMPAVRRHLELAVSSPGMAESALADQLVQALLDVPDRWDRVVVDSPPTGHLLRLLALPGLLAPWVGGVARQRERANRADAMAMAVAGTAPGTESVADDPLLVALHARRRRLEEAAAILRSSRTQVRLVLVPRRMVVAETARAVAELTGSGVPLGSAVLNQLTPEADAEIVREVETLFGDAGVVSMPQQEIEPIGADALRAVAARLGSGQPRSGR